MPGSSFRSSVKYRDQLFVLCASGILNSGLAARFDCDACVEISDVEKFTARLKTALCRQPQVKLGTFRRAAVTYYRTADPPKSGVGFA